MSVSTEVEEACSKTADIRATATVMKRTLGCRGGVTEIDWKIRKMALHPSPEAVGLSLP